jgi:hypothetical protein
MFKPMYFRTRTCGIILAYRRIQTPNKATSGKLQMGLAYLLRAEYSPIIFNQSSLCQHVILKTLLRYLSDYFQSDKLYRQKVIHYQANVRILQEYLRERNVYPR